MQRENETLLHGGVSRSRGPAAEPLLNPPVTGVPIGEVIARPSAAAMEKIPIRPVVDVRLVVDARPAVDDPPASVREARFLDVLRPLLEQVPEDPGRRLPTQA